MMNFLRNWKFAGLAVLTMGLAPFAPEPHIWGKLKWIYGGSIGMKPLDWGDAIMHGLPWIWFLIAGLLAIIALLKKTSLV